MDPYSPEGELLNIHTAFHAGAFKNVVEFDTSSFSPSNALPARVLKLRSRIALGDSKAVISELNGEKTPDLVAVRLLAEYEEGKDGVVEQVRKLTEQHGKENLTVQLCGGIILSREDEAEEALQLLSLHQGSLDAVALIVHTHLQQNRTDLAIKEAQRARKWAQDSLLVNLAEAWIGLREGGEKYQSAFYVFEELATTPQTTSPSSLTMQAVAELHLHRFPEAEAALNSALSLDPNFAEAIVNLIVLNTILGRQEQVEEGMKRLEQVAPKHKFLEDWRLKREEFGKAAGRYQPKFEI